MSEFFDSLDNTLKSFIGDQHLFFVSTAPEEGRINLSPKGMDAFRVLDDNTVCYLDLTGSGNETAAHLKQNGRITVMWCSFTRTANILRIYGTGRVVRPGCDEFDWLIDLFPALPGVRQIMVIDVDQAQTSCGYAVPEFELKQERKTLLKWADGRGEEGIRDYWADRNQTSIDGLPTGILDDG